MTLIGLAATQLWLKQFRNEDDLALAQDLLRVFRLVPASELRLGLIRCLDRLAEKDPVAVFIEREIRKVSVSKQGTYVLPGHFRAKGETSGSYKYIATVPWRMYKERISNKTSKKRPGYRAHGAALKPVDAKRSDKQEVGSEGLLATYVSSLGRANRNRVLVHPSAELMRKRRVRRLVVVTDFIGSGTRLWSMLDSLWRVRSIRSWHSLGLVRFHVLAFSATEAGRCHVKRHPTQPTVEAVFRCPTIDNSFSGEKRLLMQQLCERYSPVSENPLGFGDAQALIAFEHSCPNNVPAIFTEKGGPLRWVPLFPQRITSEVFEQWGSLTHGDRLSLGLEALRFSNIALSAMYKNSTDAQRSMIITMAALRRGRSDIAEIVAMTGLSLSEVGEGLRLGKGFGYLDSGERLTAEGQGLLRRLSSEKAKLEPASESDIRYYPKQLRSPGSHV